MLHYKHYLHSFDPTVQSNTKKPGPTPDHPTGGICDPWGHNVHVHTQAHTSVTETTASPRPGGKAGPSCGDVRENKRDWVKLAAGHEMWDDWFTRGSKSSCSVCEQVAVPSLSHC